MYTYNAQTCWRFNLKKLNRFSPVFPRESTKRLFDYTGEKESQSPPYPTTLPSVGHSLRRSAFTSRRRGWEIKFIVYIWYVQQWGPAITLCRAHRSEPRKSILADDWIHNGKHCVRPQLYVSIDFRERIMNPITRVRISAGGVRRSRVPVVRSYPVQPAATVTVCWDRKKKKKNVLANSPLPTPSGRHGTTDGTLFVRKRLWSFVHIFARTRRERITFFRPKIILIFSPTVSRSTIRKTRLSVSF